MNFGLLCCANVKYFDFMSCVAAVPRPITALGFDPSVGAYKVVFAPGGFEKWVYATYPDELGSPHGFYREMEVIEEYEEGCKITTTNKAYFFYQNLADTMDNIVNGTANSLNPYQDLRLTGIPVSHDATTKVVTEGDWTAGGTRDIASFDQIVQMMLAYDDHPPTFVDENQVIFHYRAEWDPTTAPYPVSLKTRTVTLRGKMTDAELQGIAEGMLLPLVAGSDVGTREGLLRFDYFGTDATYAQPPELNYIPAGARYDSSGFYTVAIPAKQMLGITLGANDETLANWSTLFPDATPETFKFNSGFPYHWPDGASYDYTMTTPVKPTIFNGGVNGYNGVSAAVPDTTMICCLGSSLRLGGGVPDALVTARITITHSNILLVFPLRGGNVVTAQYDNVPPVAMRIHSGFSPDYGMGWGGALDGRCQGFLAASMRVRIPQDAMSKSDDVTFFRSGAQNGISSYIFPTNTVGIWMVNKADYTEWQEQYLLTMPAGEYLYYPSDITSPTGWGFLYFGADASASRPTGSGDGNIGAGDNVGSTLN